MELNYIKQSVNLIKFNLEKKILFTTFIEKLSRHRKKHPNFRNALKLFKKAFFSGIFLIGMKLSNDFEESFLKIQVF